jgi:hypothetical protein
VPATRFALHCEASFGTMGQEYDRFACPTLAGLSLLAITSTVFFSFRLGFMPRFSTLSTVFFLRFLLHNHSSKFLP